MMDGKLYSLKNTKRITQTVQRCIVILSWRHTCVLMIILLNHYCHNLRALLSAIQLDVTKMYSFRKIDIVLKMCVGIPTLMNRAPLVRSPLGDPH